MSLFAWCCLNLHYYRYVEMDFCHLVIKFLNIMIKIQLTFLIFGGIICCGFSGLVRLGKRNRYLARQEITTNNVTPYPLANDLKPEIQFVEMEPQDDRNVGDSRKDIINSDSKPDEIYGPPEIALVFNTPDKVYGPPETDVKSESLSPVETLARHKTGQTRLIKSGHRFIYRQLPLPQLRLI
uniref:Uncharacterized protein n=1 Tax=Glossina brevipalpis TaxID=37001 RepID=A0A1A9WFI0_9MUSC